MDMNSIISQIQTIFGYLLGGTPTFLLTVFSIIFGLVALSALYKAIFPNATAKLPQMPKTPPLSPEAAKISAQNAKEPETPQKSKFSTWLESKKWLPFHKKTTATIRHISLPNLEKTFRHNLQKLEEYIAGKDARYQIPWFLMLGEVDSGKTTALSNVTLTKPFSFENQSATKGCDWHFFNQGIVFDLAGDCVLYQDNATQTFLSDERGWKGFLRLLQIKRERRPLDGLIISIPATDLIQNNNADVLFKKASMLYQKLWQAQKILGMRLPIYILITKADCIEGFKDFCQVLPPHLLENIFGWSNPFSLETPFKTTLIDDAFKKIYQELNQLQLEIVATEKVLSNHDKFLLFPHNLRPAFNNLRTYLEQLFKSSSYHEAFLLRGIYFIGDAGQIQLNQQDNQTSSDQLAFTPSTENTSYLKPVPIFLAQLFKEKIFAEAGLAKPIHNTHKIQNKLLRVMQVSTVSLLLFAIITQWFAFKEIEQRKTALNNTFNQITKDINSLHTLKANVQFNDAYFSELKYAQKNSAKNLLNELVALNVDSMKSIWIPSSWFSQIDQQIIDVFSIAYNQLVLDLIYQGLHQKIRELLKENTEEPNSNSDSKALGQLVEFQRIVAFIKNISDVEKNIKIFNNLKESKDQAKNIGSLVEYLYQIVLPMGFYTNAQLYSAAIAQAEHSSFDFGLYQSQIRTKLVSLREGLYAKVFKANALEIKVKNLAEQLDNLAQASRYTEWFDILKKINTSTLEIKDYINQPESAWMISADFDLGADFTQLLKDINDVSLLGQESHNELNETAHTEFVKLREQLQSYHSNLTGVFLKPRNALKSEENPQKESEENTEKTENKEETKESTDARLTLSPAVLNLNGVINNFLQRDFMLETQNVQPLLSQIPANKTLLWDANKLSQAVKLAESFHQFLNNELKKFPESLQEIAKNAGYSQLYNNLMLKVSSSQTVEIYPNKMRADFEKRMRKEVDNFTQSAIHLSSLLQFIKDFKNEQVTQEKFTNFHDDLESVTVLQSYRLLAATNRILEEDDLYKPRQTEFFSTKENDKNIAFIAFNVSDKDELNYYLKAQRDRVHYLAQNYAQILLNFLAGKSIPAELGTGTVIPRWTRLYMELFKYDTEKPENSLKALESFILNDLDDVNLENCYSRLYDLNLDQESGDFFVQKQQKLKSLLFKKCQEKQLYLSIKEVDNTNKQMLKTKLALNEGMFWDVSLLQKATEFAETFSNFVETEYPKLPDQEKKDFEQKGYAQFHIDFIDKLAQAQSIAPHAWNNGNTSFEEGLKSEITNFFEATEKLDGFIAFLDTVSNYESSHQDKFTVSKKELLELTLTQALRLLQQTDLLLQEDNLYHLKGDKFFIGEMEKPLSFSSFTVSDKIELTNYLKTQRERIKLLAKDYAQPLLTFIADKESQTKVEYADAIPRWTKIYTELFKYDTEKPENALISLENFINNDLDKVTPVNCYVQLYPKQEANPQTNDFFTNKRSEIQMQLFEQCKQQLYFIMPNLAENPLSGIKKLTPHSKIALNSTQLWKTQQLQQAINSANLYSEFLTNIEKYPFSVQKRIKEKSYAEFYTHIMHALAKAQIIQVRETTQKSPHLEELLDQEIQNFIQAAPLLSWMSVFFEQLGKTESPEAKRFIQAKELLDTLGIAQAQHLLTSTNKFLEESHLYTTKTSDFFIHWDNLQPLSAMAFGVSDKVETDFYLKTQRERARFLAQKYAQPLLTYLSNKSSVGKQAQGDVIPRWTRMYTELFKYENEDPENSLTKLENFIRIGMNKINLGNCYTELEDAGRNSGDFFTEKLAKLHTSLFEQCRFIADLEAYRRYHLIADFFNQKLAGKFPFAEVSKQPAFSEADPEQVQNLFAIYMTYGEGLQEFINNSRTFEKNRDVVIQFLDKLEAVKLFLEPLIKQPMPVTKPILDFVVDFRVNQEREHAANQVIGWYLEKGGHGTNTFINGQPKKKAVKPTLVADREGSWHFNDRWMYGESLRFSFRWARNSAFRPFLDGVSQGISLAGEDDTAIFEFRGYWALLEMIRKHSAKPEDFDSLEDAQPHTLKFEIPVRRLAGEKRIPLKQRVPKPAPLPPRPPSECYMDWYEESFGDKRCLEGNFKKLENAPSPTQSKKAFEARQQVTPYPSITTEDGTLTSENIDRFEVQKEEEFLDIQKARLFVRFNLMHPDKKEQLIVPDFPMKAPLLQTPSIKEFQRYTKRLNNQRFLPNKPPAEIINEKTSKPDHKKPPAEMPANKPVEEKKPTEQPKK